MKAKAQKTKEEFKSVTIEITFETREEMKAFKSLTEYTPATKFFRNAGLDPLAINHAIPCKSHLENGEWSDFVAKVEGKSND